MLALGLGPALGPALGLGLALALELELELRAPQSPVPVGPVELGAAERSPVVPLAESA